MASSQKWVGKNRPPRVQIEYDTELYGAQQKVNLPFVMGVMSDLSGKNNSELPGVGDRKFSEVDVDTFDSYLKDQKPRVACQVPNTLTGEGNLNVDISFTSMEDFSPARVAQSVSSTRSILEARQKLSNLLGYMDGKEGAEELIAKVIQDPALRQALMSAAKEADDGEKSDG